jgi:hypothetical protein
MRFDPIYKLGARFAIVPALACTVLVIHDAATPAPSYASAYDGADPHPCTQGAGNAGPIDSVPLKAANGTVLGELRLIESRKCGSLWPQVHLTAAAEKATLGRTIRLSVNRPADNETAPYNLALKGGPYGRWGFGNMLGGTACVRASAQLLAGDGQPAGPVEQTKCFGG